MENLSELASSASKQEHIELIIKTIQTESEWIYVHEEEINQAWCSDEYNHPPSDRISW